MTGAASVLSLAAKRLLPRRTGWTATSNSCDPMLTVREIRAQVTAVHQQTADTVTLTVRPNRAWPGFTPASTCASRCRSTACCAAAATRPRNSRAATATARVHGQGAPRRPGLRATCTPTPRRASSSTCPTPTARSACRHHGRTGVLLISGGSGITPVMAMLRTLSDEGHTGEVDVPALRDTAADAPYLAELRDAGRNVTPNVHFVLAYTAATTVTSRASSAARTWTRPRPGTARRRPTCAARAALMRASASCTRTSGWVNACTPNSSPPPPVDRAEDADRPGPLHPQRPDVPTTPANAAAGAGRGGRADAGARLPDGHLLLLHAGQDAPAACATRCPATRRPRRTRKSSSASPSPSGTSTIDL